MSGHTVAPQLLEPTLQVLCSICVGHEHWGALLKATCSSQINEEVHHLPTVWPSLRQQSVTQGLPSFLSLKRNFPLASLEYHRCPMGDICQRPSLLHHCWETNSSCCLLDTGKLGIMNPYVNLRVWNFSFLSFFPECFLFLVLIMGFLQAFSSVPAVPLLTPASFTHHLLASW